LTEARSSEGVTNPAFDGHDFVLEEKPDASTRFDSPRTKSKPTAEESICIYKFDQPVNRYIVLAARHYSKLHVIIAHVHNSFKSKLCVSRKWLISFL
jgi:hypothetical protein